MLRILFPSSKQCLKLINTIIIYYLTCDTHFYIFFIHLYLKVNSQHVNLPLTLNGDLTATHPLLITMIFHISSEQVSQYSDLITNSKVLEEGPTHFSTLPQKCLTWLDFKFFFNLLPLPALRGAWHGRAKYPPLSYTVNSSISLLPA